VLVFTPADPSSIRAADAKVPPDISLQVYPNPFNHTLQIKLTYPARVSIFDSAGKRIRLLSGDWEHIPDLNLTWNGRDEAGRDISSGIYFILAENSRGKKIVKTIYLK
jgi:hypothetical protein